MKHETTTIYFEQKHFSNANSEFQKNREFHVKHTRFGNAITILERSKVKWRRLRVRPLRLLFVLPSYQNI